MGRTGDLRIRISVNPRGEEEIKTSVCLLQHSKILENVILYCILSYSQLIVFLVQKLKINKHKKLEKTYMTHNSKIEGSR